MNLQETIQAAIQSNDPKWTEYYLSEIKAKVDKLESITEEMSKIVQFVVDEKVLGVITTGKAVLKEWEDMQ